MFANEKVSLEIEVREIGSSLTSFYIRIIGSYFLDSKISSTIKRTILKADKTKQLVISCIMEPNLFITKMPNNNPVNIFEYLHNLCDTTGFSADKITLLTSNLYATQSYTAWASINERPATLNVIDQQSYYWIKRVVDKGYHKIVNVEPTKHFTCFIGRPRLQKNNVVKWYVEKIQNTVNAEKMFGTFLYENVIGDIWFEDNRDKVSRLPGRIEDNSRDHTNAFLNGNADKFNRAMASGLINLTVDFTEEENFGSVEEYKNFKAANIWWAEDTIAEKTFKCVLLKKPFIRLGGFRSLETFKSWGFKTFDKILFDESYDQIADLTERTTSIIAQVEKYLALDFNELRALVNTPEVTAIIEHNYNLAYEIINNRKDAIYV